MWETPNPPNIKQIFCRHGFAPYRYDPAERRLSPIADPADGGQNTIYVRVPAVVEARVASASATTRGRRPI